VDLYNEKNEEIKVTQLEKLFHETLPIEEVFEFIYRYSFRFMREDGLVVGLSFLDVERDAYISVYKNNREIVNIIYRQSNYIKILDEENKIFEIISKKNRYNPATSTTILSLAGSPIVQFNDDLENEKRIMDVIPTDLMVLFDDFDEIQQHDSINEGYRFLCKRSAETAELIIFPGTGKFSLIIKSGDIFLCAVDLVNCDRIVANLKQKKLFFTCGFNEITHFTYIKCCLDLGEQIGLLVEPNLRPWLRGLG
jgi:hypothetical protein